MFTVLSISLATSGPAHAYIDPGAGSIMLQGIIAALAGVGVVLKLFWSKIKSLFGMGLKRMLSDNEQGARTGEKRNGDNDK